MPSDATFESFEKELLRLVEKFGRNLAELKSSAYDEAKLRLEYCRSAIEHQLRDDTQNGFPFRLRRLLNKERKAIFK